MQLSCFDRSYYSLIFPYSLRHLRICNSIYPWYTLRFFYSIKYRMLLSSSYKLPLNSKPALHIEAWKVHSTWTFLFSILVIDRDFKNFFHFKESCSRNIYFVPCLFWNVTILFIYVPSHLMGHTLSTTVLFNVSFLLLCRVTILSLAIIMSFILFNFIFNPYCKKSRWNLRL